MSAWPEPCCRKAFWGMQDQMSGAAKQDAEEPLRLGVIGVGIMGSNHARVLADLSGVKVVGIADPGASHRALLGQVIGCAVCDDADALLDMGIDAAVIAAPTHLHHDIALTCIKRGRSEEHTSELQSLAYLVCRLLLEK